MSCSIMYYKYIMFSNNKYAIYAYTHGPVTGSGPSVVPSTVVELRVPPPPSLPPPLFSQCEANGPPIGVGREKNTIGNYVCMISLQICCVLYIEIIKN